MTQTEMPAAQASMPSLPPGLFLPTVSPVDVTPSEASPGNEWGRVADLGHRIRRILGKDQQRRPALVQPQLVVFAADHGIADEGVSRFSQDATRHRVEALLSGANAVNRMARDAGIELTVVDAGVAVPLSAPPAEPGVPPLLLRKIGYGTRNMVLRSAMSTEQTVAALRAGMDVVRHLPGNAILIGETGVANTSSAILLLSRLCGVPLADACGHHPDLGDEMVRHKLEKLFLAATRHRKATRPLDAMVTMGGFELAMMTGAMIQSASEGRLVVVDGFVASAAALVARGLNPAVGDYLVYSHLSADPGHRLLMIHLQERPLLDMELRLGQGAGALLAWPLIRAAERMAVTPG
jgi:nicotinate-nucleotide--dimethylbenzimidazole phosphoribosyltransferase